LNELISLQNKLMMNNEIKKQCRETKLNDYFNPTPTISDAGNELESTIKIDLSKSTKTGSMGCIGSRLLDYHSTLIDNMLNHDALCQSFIHECAIANYCSSMKRSQSHNIIKIITPNKTYFTTSDTIDSINNPLSAALMMKESDQDYIKNNNIEITRPVTDYSPQGVFKLLEEYLAEKELQISEIGLKNIKDYVNELFCTKELANEYDRNKIFLIMAKNDNINGLKDMDVLEKFHGYIRNERSYITLDVSVATRNAYPQSNREAMGLPPHQYMFDIFFELLRFKRMADCGLISMATFENIRSNKRAEDAWDDVIYILNYINVWREGLGNGLPRAQE